jgi:multiple sugar transport system permease protein
MSVAARDRTGAAGLEPDLGEPSQTPPAPNPKSKIQNPKFPRIQNPKSTIERRQALAGYLFIAPGLLLFLVFVLGPVAYAFYLSFTDYDVFTRQNWVGLENYQLVLEDEIFWRAAGNTLYYAAVSIPVGMAVSLFLAVLLNQRIKGMTFFRTAYYLPVVSSMVAVSMIWVQLFDPSYGVVNYALGLIGLSGPDWLGDPDLAMPAIIAMSVWKGLGWNMLIYLAGLQGIPGYLKEAAQIDGASRWQVFWNVTLPLLKPTTFFIFVTSCIGAFQVFDQVYVMTQGGPANATTTIVHQIYNAAFKSLEMGYAASMSFILFGVILAVSLANLRSLRSEVEYH